MTTPTLKDYQGLINEIFAVNEGAISLIDDLLREGLDSDKAERTATLLLMQRAALEKLSEIDPTEM